MKVSIDESAGFCKGVVRAIELAESVLKESTKVYCLGDIIHNVLEVKRLQALGLETVSVSDLSHLEPGSKVLVRAHGEPPSTYKTAFENGLEVIDATCPIVTKVQEAVRNYMDKEYQVVVFGKRDHAEVVGIRGVTNDKAIVVSSVEEVNELVDFYKPTVLFSQTTMDKKTFGEIADALKKRIEILKFEMLHFREPNFQSKDTICGFVAGREKKLQKFCRENEVIIFTAGRKSSNGKVLFNMARKINPNTFFAEKKNDIKWEWFENSSKIGITGATSTPHWIMREMKVMIEEHFIGEKRVS